MMGGTWIPTVGSKVIANLDNPLTSKKLRKLGRTVGVITKIDASYCDVDFNGRTIRKIPVITLKPNDALVMPSFEAYYQNRITK